MWRLICNPPGYHSFTLCGSGCGTGNGNASKWVVSLFLQPRQWQTYTVVTVICHCHKCSCEHFHFIVAEKPLPLPHRVNEPLVRKFNPTVSLQESDERLRYKLQKLTTNWVLITSFMILLVQNLHIAPTIHLDKKKLQFRPETKLYKNILNFLQMNSLWNASYMS